MNERLRRSIEAGAHARMARMVGEWAGETRTWFEPGKLADTSPWRGTVRSILEGAFVEIAYEGAIGGEALRGRALLGHHLDRERWEMAWVDGFHTGTAVMYSTGAGADGGIDVRGHYPAGDGPDWGWRTVIEQPDADRLVITMFNVTPGGEEAKAVEVQWRRVR